MNRLQMALGRDIILYDVSEEQPTTSDEKWATIISSLNEQKNVWEEIEAEMRASIDAYTAEQRLTGPLSHRNRT